MNVAVCVEKSGGMMFGGRRVSQDRMVRQRLMELAGTGILRVSPYTARQFTPEEPVQVCADPFNAPDQGDICFAEELPVPMERVERVYLFQWNRDYPADVYFDCDLKALGFRKVKTENFAGYSHKKITLEIYQRGK